MGLKRYLEPFMLPARVERLAGAAATRTRNLTVVLDGVHDPHNLSAVVRSCEGFGLLDVHVIESHGRLRLSHKVSQGAEKWLDVHTHEEPDGCLRELRAGGFDLWVADPRPGSVGIDRLPFGERLALVFGNEHEGASPEVARAARGTFRIPMCGFTQSFNVSVAVGIALALAVEQRNRLGGHGDLSVKEQAALVTEWQRRSVKHADKIISRLGADKEREEACHDRSV